MNFNLKNIIEWLNWPLFNIGGNTVTLIGIGMAILIIVLTIVFSTFIERIVSRQLSKRGNLSTPVIYAFNRIIHYVFVIFGVIIAFESMGLKLSSLTIIFGFLGVGVGFGLQNVTSNFISGVILLIDRPIGVGDLVTINDRTAEVVGINLRTTTVRTFDHVVIIVPNSKFIENEVINWTVGDPRIRIHCPVGVAYGTDEKRVKEVLIQVGLENDKVLHDPGPDVRFLEFGDSSLNFDLLVWTGDPENQKTLRSELNFAIAAAFRENHITIPFPQQDVYLQLTPAIEKLAAALGERNLPQKDQTERI